MKWIVIVFIALVVFGAVIAVYERLRGKTVMAHDFTKDPDQAGHVHADHARKAAPAGLIAGMNGPQGGV